MLSNQTLKKVLDVGLSTGADFAEVFAEDTFSSELSLLNGSPRKAIVGQMYGASIRLFFGSETIFVTTNDLSEAGLTKAAKQAAQARGSGRPKQMAEPFSPTSFDQIHIYGSKPWESDRNEKLNFLQSLDQISRNESSLVVQVEPHLLEKSQKIQVANSMGMLGSDERNYTRLFLKVSVESEGQKEEGIENVGWLGTSENLETLDKTSFVKKAVSTALKLLSAQFAPAGEMPVVLDNGFGGVIFHEACGHGLETTSVAKGASVFCDLLEKKVAHSSVTAIDDGTIANSWGSLSMDDEGRLTQKTVLIENGILKSYLVDEKGARQTGYTPTGSARRQSYKIAPTSRMRNTYIAPGEYSLEQLIGDIDYGIYAKKMGGGSVSPGSGEFNFSIVEAYLIKNGKIAEIVKGASLIGKGIETLGRIEKVGRDLKLSAGMCGSSSGNIPVTVGQPPLLVSKILVGGRA
ncbi:MAG TPA: TldD/PmbA family protein [Pseudobdellovibrionaceae bacterium]|nr:TldD/PmbA family protein [Pseudobdellovibrionaceae bacterium]